MKKKDAVIDTRPSKTIQDCVTFLAVAAARQEAIAKRRIQDRHRKKSKEEVNDEKTNALFASDTKFDAAIDKVRQRIIRELKKPDGYYDWLADKQRDCALEDANGKLMYEDREKNVYAYDTEGQKELDDAVRKKMKEYISFESYILPDKDLPTDLNETLVDAFRGFVLPENYEIGIETESLKSDEPTDEPNQPASADA